MPTRGASGQRKRLPVGRQKLSRARFPGGVQTDTACKHPHGLAVVCSVCRSLNYVLSGKAASPWCKLRPHSEHVRTQIASPIPGLRAGLDDITSRAPFHLP